LLAVVCLLAGSRGLCTKSYPGLCVGLHFFCLFVLDFILTYSHY
jgi:hypothetical protein